MPNLKSIFQLYDKTYFNSQCSRLIGYTDYTKTHDLKLRTFKRWFKEIELFQNPGYYLDVGCAYGFSIEIAQQSGWKSEGIDISKYACEQVRKTYTKNIYNEDFLAFTPIKNYDLVTAWDVIEHTISPTLFFAHVKQCLKNHGIFALCTPDYSSLFARIPRKSWFEYKWPEHIYFLSRETLKLYCKKLDFEILELKYAVKYKTLSDAIARWLGFYENKNQRNSKIANLPIPYSSLAETFLIARLNK